MSGDYAWLDDDDDDDSGCVTPLAKSLNRVIGRGDFSEIGDFVYDNGGDILAMLDKVPQLEARIAELEAAYAEADDFRQAELAAVYG